MCRLETAYSGRFSDNGFLQAPGSGTVVFFAWEDVQLADLRNSLSIRSLWSVYH